MSLKCDEQCGDPDFKLNINKLGGYRRRLLHEWRQLGLFNTLKDSFSARQKVRRVRSWLSELEREPPEVILGGNFAPVGGVRHHLEAIERFSRLRISRAPSDRLLQQIPLSGIASEFESELFEYSPHGVLAVHSHVYPWFMNWAAMLQKSGIRWVHTYHLNYYPEHRPDGMLHWQEQINRAMIELGPKADVRLSVSRWQEVELRNRHGIETTYLPNGVDILACDEACADQFRKKFNLQEFVLWVGRDDPVKNPEEFVRLTIAMPDVNFVMVCDGLDEDEIQQRWSISVPGNLVLMGKMSHGETLDAIAACSALVVTSKREGLPTLVMEAMALAKPIVVSNEPGSVEAVDNGRFGYIYELGSMNDLSHNLTKALSDRQVGGRARARALAEYDWREIATRLDAIYMGAQ